MLRSTTPSATARPAEAAIFFVYSLSMLSALAATVRGTALYFLADSSLTLVLRPEREPLWPTQTLALLQQGPNGDERAANLTSEVPAGLNPVTVTTDASGNVDVVVSADVTTLSTTAVDQIVCTVRDTLSTTAPVTLTSDAATRGPRICPLPG